ncbi:MAG: SCP2 sterol-binding domain-containing protein [Oscillospiraceae bacterium]|jgi:putative sterol carrier protein|nr:SCP2 sterol-binding domain-containing protein [Oscillospiraceae bacterium]
MANEVQDIIVKINKKIAEANLDLSGVKETVAFQFNLTGKLPGVFYIELKDGKINVEPYEYNDRNALISTTKTNLEKIISGSLKLPIALATGKVKVEGDLEKVKMLGAILKNQ